MADDDTALRDAYNRLEKAIGDVSRIETFEGVLTEWVVVTSYQRYGDDGKAVVQIGRLVSDGTAPYHRVMGLLDYAQALYRAEVTED